MTGDPIAVTSDGGTLRLECFAESPEGPGLSVVELRPGTSWGQLAEAVQEHQERYKCARDPEAPPAAGPRRLLVTGSRTWPDEELLRAALLDATGIPASGPLDWVLVHGACPSGADAMAAAWAADYGVPAEPHPARWAELGSAAGYTRNTEMATAGADVALAFLAPCARHAGLPPHDSHGAADCAARAEAAGIRVKRFRPGQNDPADTSHPNHPDRQDRS